MLLFVFIKQIENVEKSFETLIIIGLETQSKLK